MKSRLLVVVASDGEVSGTGTFDHGGTTCEGGGRLPAHSGTFEAIGKKTEETFTFQLVNPEPPYVGPRVFAEEARVPIDNGVSGEADVAPFGGALTYHVTLECKTCEGAG